MRTLIILVLLAVGAGLSAQEKFTQAKPTVKPQITEWTLAAVRIDKVPAPEVRIEAVSNTGERVSCFHTDTTREECSGEGQIRVCQQVADPQATTLIRALNAPNRAKSLERQALEHLRDHGLFAAGSVAGSPQ